MNKAFTSMTPTPHSTHRASELKSQYEQNLIPLALSIKTNVVGFLKTRLWTWICLQKDLHVFRWMFMERSSFILGEKKNQIRWQDKYVFFFCHLFSIIITVFFGNFHDNFIRASSFFLQFLFCYESSPSRHLSYTSTERFCIHTTLDS